MHAKKKSSKVEGDDANDEVGAGQMCVQEISYIWIYKPRNYDCAPIKKKMITPNARIMTIWAFS